MEELLHQFQHGPITARIFRPNSQAIVLSYRFEFVKVKADGTQSTAFEWLDLSALARAAELTRQWVREQADAGNI